MSLTKLVKILEENTNRLFVFYEALEERDLNLHIPDKIEELFFGKNILPRIPHKRIDDFIVINPLEVGELNRVIFSGKNFKYEIDLKSGNLENKLDFFVKEVLFPTRRKFGYKTVRVHITILKKGIVIPRQDFKPSKLLFDRYEYFLYEKDTAIEERKRYYYQMRCIETKITTKSFEVESSIEDKNDTKEPIIAEIFLNVEIGKLLVKSLEGLI